jgi:hypothetical protein
MLLAAGATADGGAGSQGATPLESAVAHRLGIAIIRPLLEHGADAGLEAMVSALFARSEDEVLQLLMEFCTLPAESIQGMSEDWNWSGGARLLTFLPLLGTKTSDKRPKSKKSPRRNSTTVILSPFSSFCRSGA